MRSDTWVFIFPVGELYLMDAVNREFRVDRITLVHKDKLPRIRRRLGLRTTVSEIKKSRRLYRRFFEDKDAWAFAVVEESGSREEVKQRSLETIREELSILSVSQLGYHSRKQMVPIVAPGEIANSYVTYLAVNSQNGSKFGNHFRRTKPFGQMVLDGRWKNYQDKVFFTELLNILRGETEVEDEWRDELRRASVMIGESIGASDLLKSFVWNWVALETLLTRRGDRVGKTLPKRVEAFLGWVLYSVEPKVTSFWEVEQYEARIREVYRKRNDLLHDGKRDGITTEDIAFTDHLLLNLLSNLVAFPHLFRSKAAIAEFATKVEKERTQDVRPKARPDDLMFITSLRPDF